MMSFNIRARFGLMASIWDDIGRPGALNRLFMSPDPYSAPSFPTTSQCWSWRGHQHTNGFSSWTGISSAPPLERHDRVLWHKMSDILNATSQCLFEALHKKSLE